MKLLISFTAALLCVNLILAQAPNRISYQAVIRNGSNALVTNQPVGMLISILQSSATGNAVYVETQAPTTNANGLASLEIGAGSIVSGNFAAIDWANGPYFIKTETDPAGGSNYTITALQELLSVPYALYSANSGSSIPGPQGPQGPQGLQGPQGPQGPTGLLTAGTSAGNTTYWNGSTWVTSSANLFNNGGNIGIGTLNPQSKLHITRELNGSDNIAFRTNITSLGSSTALSLANWTTINGTSGDLSAIDGEASGLNSTAIRVGILGLGSNGLYSRGVEGQSVDFNDNPMNVNEGVIGFARNSNYSNIALAGYCYDEDSPTGLGDHYGVVGISECYSSIGTNYGIYAEATNGAYNYAGFLNGEVIVVGTLNNPSDERLKTNIKPMNSSLDIIRQLTPVEYDYKREGAGKSLNLPQKHQYGFIAQDLQKVLPDLVSNQKMNPTMHGGRLSKNKSNSKAEITDAESIEFLGINYTSIIPFLVQGMKEQDDKIKELEQLVMELKQQVQDSKD